MQGWDSSRGCLRRCPGHCKAVKTVLELNVALPLPQLLSQAHDLTSGLQLLRQRQPRVNQSTNRSTQVTVYYIARRHNERDYHN